jgi:hypothetical protein
MDLMLEEARRGWRDPELVPLFAQVTQHGDNDALWSSNEGMQASLAAMRRELAK